MAACSAASQALGHVQIDRELLRPAPSTPAPTRRRPAGTASPGRPAPARHARGRSLGSSRSTSTSSVSRMRSSSSSPISAACSARISTSGDGKPGAPVYLVTIGGVAVRLSDLDEAERDAFSAVWLVLVQIAKRGGPSWPRAALGSGGRSLLGGREMLRRGSGRLEADGRSRIASSGRVGRSRGQLGQDAARLVGDLAHDVHGGLDPPNEPHALSRVIGHRLRGRREASRSRCRARLRRRRSLASNVCRVALEPRHARPHFS